MTARGQSRQPPPSRQESIVEDVHGVRVVDPFRWLEDGEAADTREWVEAQNRFTFETLESVPQRAAIEARLDHLFTTGWVTAPDVRGQRFFYQRRSGRIDQPVLVVREGATGDERTLIDPNTLSARGTVALD